MSRWCGSGMPLLDEYLEFLEGRCRPNTVLAAAYDLQVFFAVVGKPPAEVRSADVLGFITAQRSGRRQAAMVQSVDSEQEPGGVATSTVARRLSIISGSSPTCRSGATSPRTRCLAACRPVENVPDPARECR